MLGNSNGVYQVRLGSSKAARRRLYGAGGSHPEYCVNSRNL